MPKQYKKTVIYFAGYNGYNSFKYKLLNKFFEDIHTVQFNQSANFEADLKELEEIIAESEKVYLIGSSMGCLCSLYLHFKYGFPIVLINPCYFPEEVLEHELTQDEKVFINHVREQIKSVYKPEQKEINLFIASDDELLNPESFRKEWEKNIKYLDISSEGGHGYSIFISKIDKIAQCLFE